MSFRIPPSEKLDTEDERARPSLRLPVTPSMEKVNLPFMNKHQPPTELFRKKKLKGQLAAGTHISKGSLLSLKQPLALLASLASLSQLFANFAKTAPAESG